MSGMRKGEESLNETSSFLESIGLPAKDVYELPTSNKSFDDNAQYRIEVPTVNSIETCKTIFEEATRLNITVNRIDETLGTFRHTKQELMEYVKVCKNYGAELNLSVGPRAIYDVSATRLSEQGKMIAYRLRGQDQIIRAIEDIKRGIDIGCRGFIIYDEGLLWVLNEMRKGNKLPPNIKFKNSAHNGHGNPASFKLLEKIGANSINPVRDLSLPMIAALRASVNVPLDLHVDNPIQSGGFIRTYEVPEIIRIASPVYLKTGNSMLTKHGQITGKEDAVNMMKQVCIVDEIIKEYYPEAIQSKNGGLNMCIPE
ncbi:MAG: peptidase [Oscillospiraceae bacterium]|nr:peptidase [Oscillospiraceae bacterium]